MAQAGVVPDRVEELEARAEEVVAEVKEGLVVVEVVAEAAAAVQAALEQ